MGPKVLELCAGAGGQALGLEWAGFDHLALIENDKHACQTLRLNRPKWNVIERDLFEFKPKDMRQFQGVDVVAGGLPCPPFSVAGKQLGDQDERNLFNVGMNFVDELRPKAVMFENVKGMLDPKFEEYRGGIDRKLSKWGYVPKGWRLLHASDFGVPQLRPRVVMVAVRSEYAASFCWPDDSDKVEARTVGQVLGAMMASNGWKSATSWAKGANSIAPTLVGGSKKHGGPDLGPTRSRKAWEALRVDGKGISDAPPPRDFAAMPRLTVQMAAALQGFPPDWEFTGGKTAAYRQVGNAFPAQVAEVVGRRIVRALSSEFSYGTSKEIAA